MEILMDVDAALSEVPVNIMPLLDDTDFKTRETAVAYNAAGMDLVWNFVTTNGSFTQTAVTPTTGGNYDWAHQGDGMYTIEIPASGGASINNDTEGFGWFTGVATGVLPWRGPIITFRASGLNDLLIDSAYSATRGLAGTALPNAAADAAGGLPISDAGGLDIDTLLGRITGNVATAAKLLSYFQSALRKDVTVDADIGGNYDDATDSQEAIRDRGDSAWATATSVAVANGGIQSTSFAAGAIDSAAIAADAIGASELAAGAVDEIFDEQIGDSTITFRQALKLMVAVLGGKASGAATTTMTFRNAADTTDVIVATVDADGNRTAVTLSL